jgi:hypothetical protein
MLLRNWLVSVLWLVWMFACANLSASPGVTCTVAASGVMADRSAPGPVLPIDWVPDARDKTGTTLLRKKEGALQSVPFQDLTIDPDFEAERGRIGKQTLQLMRQNSLISGRHNDLRSTAN